MKPQTSAVVGWEGGKMDREGERGMEGNKERDLETKIERERGTARIKGALFTSTESSERRLNLNMTRRKEFH